MTIFGLNSPEVFLLLVITLVILGTKRIEKALDLFSRLLKFLLSNQSSFDKIDKKKEIIKGIEETQENKKEILKNEKRNNDKEKESIKGMEETQENEDKSEKRLKIANLTKKENNSTKTKDPKGKITDKNVKKLNTKDSKRIVKDKSAIKSKTMNVNEE